MGKVNKFTLPMGLLLVVGSMLLLSVVAVTQAAPPGFNSYNDLGQTLSAATSAEPEYANKTIECTQIDKEEVRCGKRVFKKEERTVEPGTLTFYIYLLIVTGLVLTAGLMSGLTMGLLSLDSMSLNVIKNGGDKREKEYASAILPIVKQHHLLLVCLLLCNAAAMEALPIFLDRLVSPVAAVVISVTLVLFFGEIIPQAICTRFGLAIGANLAWLVRLLMFLLYPIAFPISKILDWVLGHDTGTFYRRAELKELVYLHGQHGQMASSGGNGEALSRDEITIIKGALDLAHKDVRSIMTPLQSVFMLEDSAVMNEELMNVLLEMGHSRIPIYQGNKNTIIGVLLVKTLIRTRPEDKIPISELYLLRTASIPASLPLYDMLNEFQTGKSHMAVVIEDDNNSPRKGEVLGVVTLEDVIEELIGEEIIDETDVYVDVVSRIKVARLLRRVSSSSHSKMAAAAIAKQPSKKALRLANSSLGGSPKVHSPRKDGIVLPRKAQTGISPGNATSFEPRASENTPLIVKGSIN
eukprot:Nk52_evm73s215 gene=Nk52_evmTU73s215